MIVINRFLAEIEQSEDYAPGTLANYRVNLRMFDQWLDSQGKTVATLTHSDLKDYRDQLKVKYKPGTINRKLTYASSFLKWCLTQGLITQNPMTKIKRVKSQDYPKWLTQEQIKKLLETAQRKIDQARSKGLNVSLVISLKVQSIFVVLLNTGLRVSELCDLKISDIQSQVITVKWGKGSKRREVPINEQARAAFETWFQVRQADCEFVFPNQGQRMTRQAVHWHIAELGKAAGIRLTPHLLRHTFGKMLADKGIALDRIAMLMGHSDVNTTAIYTMPSLADLWQVVKLLD